MNLSTSPKKKKGGPDVHKSAKKKKKQLPAENAEVAQEISTMSIAVPGSILENAHSLELKTYLAGQIARAACIYNVDEIVIFDDSGSSIPTEKNGQEEEMLNRKGCCSQMARILQYLECPQYLRKFFFPLHRDLKYCGLLNPLDAPHHLRQNNNFMFREGVVTEKPTKSGRGSHVNIGLRKDAAVDETLTTGIRVTVKLNLEEKEGKRIKGTVVSPSLPRQETGVYWGYSVRMAENISQVFSQSPHEDGYDLIIGTSDRGKNIQDIGSRELAYKHGIVVFGGVMGIEYALENDPKLNSTEPELLFEHYINTAPNQGSRTIRTEEAVLITLAGLQSKLNPLNEAKPFDLFSCIPQSQDTKASQASSNNK
ncbi:putative methyltransferase C9orf114 homolog [Phlebotomus papatasi]|uniref:putative methyltransferase C9orf114 homolog n=1 Tax=Phlebotomus papatasi TaxID=29031 RepID=UPI00248411E3|nr:putative methyltransferase C9orf114 homolog [Phlebotomus papatasi]